MEAVAALFSKAAAAGRWALGMLELGVTVPLDVADPPRADEAPEFNPATGALLFDRCVDTQGNPVGGLPMWVEEETS